MNRLHAAALLVLLGIPASVDAQPLTLRYGWTKGESRTYRMSTVTETVLTGLPNAPGPLTTSQGDLRRMG